MPPAPTAEVLGFTAPTVKGPELSIGIQVGAGIAHLRGRRSLMLEIARALLRTAEGQTRKPGSGPKRAPERVEIFQEIRAKWSAGEGTQTQLCADRGIPLASFSKWLGDTRLAENLAARDKPPITKPSGQIL